MKLEIEHCYSGFMGFAYTAFIWKENLLVATIAATAEGQYFVRQGTKTKQPKLELEPSRLNLVEKNQIMKISTQREALLETLRETTPFSSSEKAAISAVGSFGTPVITKDGFLKLIAKKHKQLWGELFPEKGIKMSSIRLDIYPAAVIQERKLSTGYTDDAVKVGLINIVFPQESLADQYLVYQSDSTTKPPGWETELLHELVHMVELMSKLWRTQKQLGQELGREATAEDLAEARPW